MVTIQKCEENHLDLLHQIAIQSYNDTYQYLWHDGGTSYLNRFYNKELFEKELTASDVFYFLIYEDEKAIGFFKLMEAAVESYPKSDCMELDKLYLLKGHTGKGIGKMVMNFSIDFTQEKQRSVLWLMVMESSAARALYEKSGFVEIKRNKLDYPNIVEEHSMILTMIKKI
ncbi:ribosomal protein S18 acetylase RimI-like enzyme [Flavobacterium sp. 270]|uniref:GNAT family N-acetyltransferase n=1 Tax=Flavobacterium sp. 270 TaxID=2512114 RepID=UPI0010E458FB|nr:GNAT family N-acetyltransferase [Flavobacterium sp. 270]TDW51771.1 ribosomal protein S18 acetylase RimI-like enzyme [Flavobacterium sp. 270]